MDFDVVTLTYDFTSMPTNEIWAYLEMVPNSNFAHRARSSQIIYHVLLKNTD